MIFEAFFPLFAAFADVRDDVVEGNDFSLLDALPNDEFPVGDRLFDEDSIDRPSIEHGDEPLLAVLICNGGNATGGFGSKLKGRTCGPVLGKEGEKSDDFLGEGYRTFPKEESFVSHGKGENHFGSIRSLTLHVEGESVLGWLLSKGKNGGGKGK